MTKFNYPEFPDSSNRRFTSGHTHIKHYNLQMIIAVGFKVNSECVVQFRKWVNQIARDRIQEYEITCKKIEMMYNVCVMKGRGACLDRLRGSNRASTL